jgi:hypothetical protein
LSNLNLDVTSVQFRVHLASMLMPTECKCPRPRQQKLKSIAQAVRRFRHL